jgi:ATP-dependent Clp protease ATP-binding subunit ClpC
MFERYTEKARRVIFYARYEASEFGASAIEAEHLLLGLLREHKALPDLYLSSPALAQSIPAEIEARTPRKKKIPTSVDLRLSHESKRALLNAPEEAGHLGHKHIGVEHLLLGLLREDGCFAARILTEQGADLTRIRAVITSRQDNSSTKNKEADPSAFQTGKQLQINLFVNYIHI